MREILFRGKAINRDRYAHFKTDYKNGDWVYGLLTKKFDERFENLPAEMTNEYGISGIDIDYKTVGQYTGLTDRNGNKVFEGDILTGQSIFHDYKEHFVCIFIEGGFYFRGERSDNDYCLDNIVSGEIIGNIYDNPELLEER